MEFASQTVRTLPLSYDIIRTIHARAVELCIPRRVGKAAVLHAHSGICTAQLLQAKRHGSTVICDHRSRFPGHAGENDPLANRLRQEFDAADYILTSSALARSDFLDRGFPAEKVVAIPLGVSTDRFVPREQARRLETPSRIFFAGRISYLKGVDLILRAAKRLGPQYQFRLAGTIRDAEVLHDGIPGNVRILGQLTQEALQEEFHNSHLLVLPSRSDAFGLVAVEAMATGLPVIISDSCGVADAVALNSAGAVFPDSDIDAFINSVQELLKDSHEYARLQHNALTTAKQHSWRAYGNRVVQLYKERIL
ncbi:glycosyltransferase family 4 protein [Actinoplanes sp. NBC_00393]